MRHNVAYEGTEIRSIITSSALTCQQKCRQTSECVAFTWNDVNARRNCSLLSHVAEVRDVKMVVSGLKRCGSFFEIILIFIFVD